MSNEEIDDSPESEEKIPLYFDRYVGSELRALGHRITDLKGIMDERFAHIEQRITDLKESIDERFTHIDQRITDLKGSTEQRITDLKESTEQRITDLRESMDERFVQVDRRFEEMTKRFDKLESTLKWAIGLFIPVIAGILVIIIKVFFFGKLTP